MGGRSRPEGDEGSHVPTNEAAPPKGSSGSQKGWLSWFSRRVSFLCEWFFTGSKSVQGEAGVWPRSSERSEDPCTLLGSVMRCFSRKDTRENHDRRRPGDAHLDG